MLRASKPIIMSHHFPFPNGHSAHASAPVSSASNAKTMSARISSNMVILCHTSRAASILITDYGSIDLRPSPLSGNGGLTSNATASLEAEPIITKKIPASEASQRLAGSKAGVMNQCGSVKLSQVERKLLPALLNSATPHIALKEGGANIGQIGRAHV